MKEKENSTSPYDKEITALDKLAQNIMGVIDPEYKNKNILSNKKIKYKILLIDNWIYLKVFLMAQL